jgi:hypothetical protein
MTYSKTKYSTVNMILGGENATVSNMNPTPFPDLDAIYGMRLPFYDMSDVMVADSAAFCENLDYIGVNQNTVSSQTLWQGILSGICFVAGTVALVFLCLSDDKKSRADRLSQHQEQMLHDD